MVQEIIVYRNPMEAVFWNMFSNGDIIPIAAGIISALAVFLFIEHNRTKYFRRRTEYWQASLLISVIVGIFVAKWLWI